MGCVQKENFSLSKLNTVSHVSSEPVSASMKPGQRLKPQRTRTQQGFLQWIVPLSYHQKNKVERKKRDILDSKLPTPPEKRWHETSSQKHLPLTNRRIKQKVSDQLCSASILKRPSTNTRHRARNSDTLHWSATLKTSKKPTISHDSGKTRLECMKIFTMRTGRILWN